MVGPRLPSHKGRQRVQARPTGHLCISGMERDGELVAALKRNGHDPLLRSLILPVISPHGACFLSTSML